MDTNYNNHHESSTLKANEKKQSNGFLCFSCLGKGRPPSSLIPEEISSVHNGNDKESVHHQPSSKEQQCTITQSGEGDIKNNKNPCDDNVLNGHADNETNEEVCQNEANYENVELQSAISENPGCSINSITVTNTTSPSHMSLSQAPTNTISSQLSAHRFPSTGLSSPPPPLKCAFLVRYFKSIICMV